MTKKLIVEIMNVKTLAQDTTAIGDEGFFTRNLETLYKLDASIWLTEEEFKYVMKHIDCRQLAVSVVERDVGDVDGQEQTH